MACGHDTFFVPCRASGPRNDEDLPGLCLKEILDAYLLMEKMTIQALWRGVCAVTDVLVGRSFLSRLTIRVEGRLREDEHAMSCDVIVYVIRLLGMLEG